MIADEMLLDFDEVSRLATRGKPLRCTATNGENCTSRGENGACFCSSSA